MSICIMIQINILFIFLFMIYVNANSFYLDCDNITQQQLYFESERIAFGVDDIPLDFTRINIQNVTHYYPMTCRENSTHIRYVGIDTPYDNVFQYLLKTSENERFPPIKSNRYEFIDRIVSTTTDSIFVYAGFEKVTYNGEQFWHYKHLTSNNTVFYLHGINLMNGIENLYTIYKIMKKSNVIISVFTPSLIMKSEYNHTLNEHLTNLNTFILQINGTISLFGNSYGSLRTVVLCKRYPDTCDKFTSIVLTDPLTINAPFSMLQKCIVNCVFYDIHMQYCYDNKLILTTIRQQKIIEYIRDNLDWYEVSIDTRFMQRFSKSLTLVIGNYDKIINVNKTSYAMTKLCNVIYINTPHGLVLFTNVIDRIEL